jgi:hypothetical protein
VVSFAVIGVTVGVAMLLSRRQKGRTA